MVVMSNQNSLYYEPMSTLLLTTIITAFSFLSAFSIRDTIVKGIEIISPNNATKEWMFTFATTIFFLFITVLLVYFFQDQVNTSN